MRFVEAVLGKLLQQVEDFVGLFGRDAIGLLAAFDEADALFGHLFSILFPHGTAEKVRLTEGVAGEQVGGLLHLLLIDQNAVGFGRDLFQQRMRVLDGLAAPFPLDVVRDELHGAWAVERQDSDDFFDPVGTELFAGIHHAARFHLEDGDGLGAFQEFEGFGVVEWHGGDFKVGEALVDVALGLVNHRKGFESQEIHLQHAQVSERSHGELGDNFSFVTTRQGDEGIERTVADDDACGVDPGAAGEALQEGGVLPEFLGIAVRLQDLLQLGILFDGLFEVDVEFRWDHFGQLVGVAVSPTQDAGDVANDALGTHGAVGDDVADSAFAVFLAHILDDLSAAALAEVDVHVRRADAFGIQEAFEDEVEAQGINVGDAHDIGNERACRRAPARANGDAMVFCPFDEIPDDQEVTGEVHLVDDAQFVVESGAQLFAIERRVPPIAELQALKADAAEVFVAWGAVLGLELRVFLDAGRVELDADVALLSDLQSGVTGLGDLGKQGAHFFSGLEIHLRGVGEAIGL